MEHSGGRDSHDTNVSVRSHITFNGPIIILGGSLLVVFVAIGGFIFFSYVFTHWGIFTKEQSPLIVNYTFLFIGVMAASVASYAVLRLVGLTFVEVLLKLAHGWQDVRHKGHEIKVQEARQNLLHTHDNYVVYREPDGAITVVPIMTETMIRRAGVQVTEEAPVVLQKLVTEGNRHGGLRLAQLRRPLQTAGR